MKSAAAVLFVWLILPPIGFAQQSPPDSAAKQDATIAPQLRKDILQLIEETKAVDKAQAAMRSMFDSMRPQLVASMPDTPNREKIVTAYEEKLVALARDQRFTDGIVAAYAKYFSDDDIKALTTFYESPAGQHFNEHYPEVVASSMQLGQRLFSENVKDILAELCKEYPELRGRARFCPAPGGESGR
jgi:uncharacterized protein